MVDRLPYLGVSAPRPGVDAADHSVHQTFRHHVDEVVVVGDGVVLLIGETVHRAAGPAGHPVGQDDPKLRYGGEALGAFSGAPREGHVGAMVFGVGVRTVPATREVVDANHPAAAWAQWVLVGDDPIEESGAGPLGVRRRLVRLSRDLGVSGEDTQESGHRPDWSV